MMTPPISPRTVIEAYLPFAGSAPLAGIYDTANLAGLADQPVRLAIRRMVASGEVEQTGRGRAGTLNLTNAGRQRLEHDRHGLALAFAQDAGDAPWDGRWRLIAVSTPEHERSARDLLRRGLHELGAVAISTGLYVSPHDLVAQLPEDARPYLSTATTDDLDVRGTSDPMLIAEALWPSLPIVNAYSTLSEAVRRDDLSTATPTIVRLLLLADALEKTIREDPLISPDLRTSPWSPSQTRAAWADRWDTLSRQVPDPPYRDWMPQRSHAEVADVSIPMWKDTDVPSDPSLNEAR